MRRIPHGHDWDPFKKADVDHVMRLNFQVRMDRDPVPERNRYAGGNFADQDTRVQTVAEMIAEMDEWIEPNSGFCGGFPTPGGGYLNVYARGKRHGRPITALQMAERLIRRPRPQLPTPDLDTFTDWYFKWVLGGVFIVGTAAVVLVIVTAIVGAIIGAIF